MTNAALQAMITQFGERIAAIIFDNSQTLFIGYKSKDDRRSLKLSDISMETIGGVDFTVVAHTMLQTDDVGNPITYKTYHVTECIQDVIIMDDGFAKYGVDPIHFK